MLKLTKLFHVKATISLELSSKAIPTFAPGLRIIQFLLIWRVTKSETNSECFIFLK
jgi:hypothetical protein